MLSSTQRWQCVPSLALGSERDFFLVALCDRYLISQIRKPISSETGK